FLPRVAQADDARVAEALERTADRLGAADGDDRDALCGEVAAEPARERLNRDPVTVALHEDDVHCPRRRRSSSASVAGSRRSLRSPRVRSACAGGTSSARNIFDPSLRTSAPEVPRTASSEETTATCCWPRFSAARRSISVSAS